MNTFQISTSKLDFSTIEDIVKKNVKLSLSEETKRNIIRCREYLDKKLSSEKEPIYGINTGFGALYNKAISDKDLEKLQQNLVMSHACGVGEEVPRDIVRLMLLLKIIGFSQGNSGVHLSTVERLIDFFNNDITPVIYQQGSLGASGDLAPLAHLSLPLIGMGEVYYKGKKCKAGEAIQKMGWKALQLKSKEGLALLNGTQFMSAYGTHCLIKSSKLLAISDIIAATSLDAFDGRIDPFSKYLHEVRPHRGQIEIARKICELLNDSEIIKQPKKHVQDPYSFRCIPQVHGASKDAFEYVKNIFYTEINAVTDNPTVFPEEDLIISGGNFHGQPLALALDFLCIALSEIGSISERRTYQLISGQRDLPLFLADSLGVNSGFMIPQYTAASIVSQNKQLCAPCSVDSIVSSNGQEDHVSMGANAATKTYQIVENLEKILAIELMTAAQALEHRKPIRSSLYIEEFINKYRKKVKFLKEDRVLHYDMIKTVDFIREVEL